MITTLIASLALAQATEAPIQLARVWKANEVVTYSVSTLLTAEQRSQELQTFLPRDFGTEYTFTLKANSVDGDGNARLSYDRPKTIAIDGEFGDTPERRRAEPGGGFKLNVRLSPINEIIGIEEVKSGDGKSKVARWNAFAPAQITNSIAGQFIGEIYGIAMMRGSLDSTMDFAPKLPFQPVRKGQTWKKTVGYTPQQLAGTKSQAVQRLDYTYTYDGVVDVNGKKVHRISAELNLDNDMWPFMLQRFGIKMSDTPIRGLQLKFKSRLRFDLDLKTFRTLYAESKSEGSTALKANTAQPLEEERFYATTTMRLVNSK